MFARLKRMLSLDENAVVVDASDEAFLAQTVPGSGIPPGSRPTVTPSGVRIAITNLTCRWTPDVVTLADVSFTVQPGEFVMVVGAVGSGKTSLLMALLHELDIDPGGSVEIGPGASIAYAPQQAWILSDTVRNNILFGLPFDPVHYRHVINKCQLTRDLEILPDGDATEVGERGVTLSGGQRARIGLARAAYRCATPMHGHAHTHAHALWCSSVLVHSADAQVWSRHTRLTGWHQRNVQATFARVGFCSSCFASSFVVSFPMGVR